MKNFEIINSKEVIDFVEAENKYKNANYIMTDIESKNGTVYGTVYAISTDPSTLCKLIELEDEFQAKGIKTLTGGEYANAPIDDIDLISIERI